MFELEFARIHPQDEILGVHNLLRYQPSRLLIYLPPKCAALDALTSIAAARLVNAAPLVLMSSELSARPVFRELAPLVQPCESVGIVSEMVRRRRIQRLRCPGTPPRALWTLPAELAVSITAGATHDDGYVELRAYLNEQSVSVSYHRYGNLSQPQVPGLPRQTADSGR